MGNVYREGGIQFRKGTLYAQWQTESSRVIYPYWPNLQEEVGDYVWDIVNYFRVGGETYALFYGERESGQ